MDTLIHYFWAKTKSKKVFIIKFTTGESGPTGNILEFEASVNVQRWNLWQHRLPEDNEMG